MSHSKTSHIDFFTKNIKVSINTLNTLPDKARLIKLFYPVIPTLQNQAKFGTRSCPASLNNKKISKDYINFYSKF